MNPFEKLGRELRAGGAGISPQHSARAHSPFSASGAERWMNCPGSVALSEGMPEKSSVWAKEGTQAHEILEHILTRLIDNHPVTRGTSDMWYLGYDSAKFIYGLHLGFPESEIQVETRIKLDFIHPAMFGTFDGAVIDHFGILHVFDYKYGAGVPVSPKENLQMIFYGLGLAHQYQYNFKRIRLWIIQPRVRSYAGPLYWDISVPDLKAYAKEFAAGVRRVEREPNNYTEGSWCHWCVAKSVCPLKRENKTTQSISIFSKVPLSSSRRRE